MRSPDPTPEETRPNLKMNLFFARVFFLGWGSMNCINNNVDGKAKDNQNLIKMSFLPQTCMNNCGQMCLRADLGDQIASLCQRFLPTFWLHLRGAALERIFKFQHLSRWAVQLHLVLCWNVEKLPHFAKRWNTLKVQASSTYFHHPFDSCWFLL